MRAATFVGILSMALVWGGPARAREPAVEDAGALVPTFQEGDVITFDQVDKLRPFLPPEFWDSHGTPLENKGKIRRYIDVGRLTKGR